MKRYTTVLLFSLLTLSGCRKLIDIDKNYIGRWRGSDGVSTYNLTITEDGGAELSIHRSFTEYGSQNWEGPLKTNGHRFQVAFASPWYIIIENPVLTHDNIWQSFASNPDDSLLYTDNNWRFMFKHPSPNANTIRMYRLKN